MPIAIAREVSPRIADCELTHLEREPLDLERARAEHARYLEVLGELGCEVQLLPAEPDLPDSVFVEDTAIVLDEVAVLTRPGAPSRRPEVATVAEALRPHRALVAIEEPGLLDGGDVLRFGRRLFVGLSPRSSEAGIEQLRRLLAPFGYEVLGAELDGCLHLKSAATALTPAGTEDAQLLINPAWVDRSAFGDCAVIEIDPDEPFAANAFPVGETIVHSDAFPKTRLRMENRGWSVTPVPASELAKAEGGVTCCSLIFER